MSGITLYRLADQLRELQVLAEQNIEDIPEEVLLDTLEGLQGELQVKASGCIAFALNLDAYADAAEEHGNRLLDRAKRIRRRSDTLREYVRVNMERTGTKKIEGPEFTISRRANPPAVVIAPDTNVPEECLQAPNPLIAAIVAAAASTSAAAFENPDAAGDTIILSRQELERVVAGCFPPRQADKKKIAERLKPVYKAHEEAVAAALKQGEPVPQRPDPLPGCSLVQGERLEVRV